MLAQLSLVVAGLWLMAAPAVLGYGDPAAASDRMAGPAMAAVAFLALFTITRGIRWVNVPVGLWLLAGPWLLGFPVDATVSSVVCGAAAVVLAPVGSPDQSRYGGGWMAVVTGRIPGAGRRAGRGTAAR